MAADGQVWRPRVAYEDERGAITDLIVGEPFDSATVITQRRGAVRGNHYHAATTQVMYLIRGRMRVVTQMPGEAARTHEAGAGDLIRTVPVERHAFVALEDSEFVVFTRGPRSGTAFEQDTVRLDEPLIAPGKSVEGSSPR